MHRTRPAPGGPRRWRPVCLAFAVTSALLFVASPGQCSPQTVRSFWETRWTDFVTTYRNYHTTTALVSSAEIDGFDWDYKTRLPLQADDTKYFLQLMESGQILLAPEVEDHVARLLAEVHPGPLPAGHPGALHVRVEVDGTPNAYALGNGMLVVTTGLLSLLRSDDELRGVLAHEVAHIYGDDRMERIRAAETRAGFAAMLTAVAGIAAGVIANQSGDPSIRSQSLAIGLGTAYATGLLSSMAVEVMGFSYTRKQEKAADATAQAWLREFGTDTLAFARALDRLGEWGRLHGATGKTSLIDTHPGTDSRLAALGFKGSKRNLASQEIPYQAGYDAAMAKVFAREAAVALTMGRYGDVIASSNRCITAGWADGNTLLARASATRLMNTNPDSLQSARAWLDRADKAGCDRSQTLVERVVLSLRMEDEAGAAKALEEWLALCPPKDCNQPSDIRKWALDTRSQLRLRGH